VFFKGIEPYIHICLTAQECVSKENFQKSASVQFKPSRSSRLDHRTKQYFTLPKITYRLNLYSEMQPGLCPSFFSPRFIFLPVMCPLQTRSWQWGNGYIYWTYIST